MTIDDGDLAALMAIAADHREVAAEFSGTVDGVAPDDWDLPAPCEGWVARDVVGHLVDWLGAFLDGTAGIVLPDGPKVSVDPAGAWHTHNDAVQALLDDPVVAGTVHDFVPMGTMSLASVIAQIYVPDVFLHRWDLARSTGQDERLNPDRCAVMLAGMEPLDEILRGSGHYGPRVLVAGDASVQDRLLGFIGRQP